MGNIEFVQWDCIFIVWMFKDIPIHNVGLFQLFYVVQIGLELGLWVALKL